MPPHKHVSVLLTGCISLLLHSAIRAQIPPGSGVYSTINVGTAKSTGSGLTLFKQYNGTGLSPCPTSPFVRIGNLPAALAIPPTSGTTGGANCVLVRDSDGSIIAATSLPGTWSMAIYQLVLNGTTVDRNRSRTHSLGSASGRGSIDQMAWLDDDQIVFSYRGLVRKGWATWGLGRLRLSTGVFTWINATFSGTVGTVNAMAVDRSKRTIHVGVFNPSAIWSVAIAGGNATRVVTLPDGPYQLDTDQSGNIYATTFNSGLYLYQPAKNALTQLIRIPQLNGMTIDRVSGDVQIAQSALRTFPSYMFRYSLVRNGALFGVPGTNRIDAVSGIAIRSCMIPMKSGSPKYWWMVAPNPGGAPLVGNASFSLTAFSSASPTAAGLLLSGSVLTSPVPVGCARLWLAAPWFQTPMKLNAARTEASVQLPIPNTPALCGARVYAQSYFLDSCGLNSVRPLQVTFQ